MTAIQDDLLAVQVEKASKTRDPLYILKSDWEIIRQEPPDAEEWPIHLLYRFDPLLLGQKVHTPFHSNSEETKVTYVIESG